jgi:hypothetical protein
LVFGAINATNLTHLTIRGNAQSCIKIHGSSTTNHARKSQLPGRDLIALSACGRTLAVAKAAIDRWA